MTCVFQEALSFTGPAEVIWFSERTLTQRGFPLAAALKAFWLCFAPRYAPLLWSGQEGKIDPYARAPTQQLFQEDRTVDVDARSGIHFTRVSSSCIPSIAEFVSSFPFIKNLRLTFEPNVKSSLTPLSQMRLLTNLHLYGATPKHLSEIVDVPVKYLRLYHFQGYELSSLFPQQKTKSRLERALRRLTLWYCEELTDISALSRFETLLELKLDSCSCLTDLSSISKLKELRALRVEGCSNVEMNSLIKAVTSLEFLLSLEIYMRHTVLDEHVKKIATIETVEILKLTVSASPESLSMLLDPQNLPNLREFQLISSTSSPFKHCADSGTYVNLEKLHLSFTIAVELDSLDISIISKKFPNLKCLFLEANVEDEADFAPLGDLVGLSELGLICHFRSQSPSLESAIAKLVNLKKIYFQNSLDADFKKMLLPLRKLEVLSFRTELEANTTNAILDLAEDGHLPGFLLLRSFQNLHRKEDVVPELLEQRRKQRREEEEEEEEEEKSKKEQEGERRQRD